MAGVCVTQARVMPRYHIGGGIDVRAECRCQRTGSHFNHGLLLVLLGGPRQGDGTVGAHLYKNATVVKNNAGYAASVILVRCCTPFPRPNLPNELDRVVEAEAGGAWHVDLRCFEKHRCVPKQHRF